MFPLYFMAYVAIGVAYTEVRKFMIKRGMLWSAMSFFDYADGYMDDNAEEVALRNNRWLWIVWPPFVFVDLIFGSLIACLMIGAILLDYALGGKKEVANEEPENPYEHREY